MIQQLLPWISPRMTLSNAKTQRWTFNHCVDLKAHARCLASDRVSMWAPRPGGGMRRVCAIGATALLARSAASIGPLSTRAMTGVSSVAQVEAEGEWEVREGRDTYKTVPYMPRVNHGDKTCCRCGDDPIAGRSTYIHVI